MKTRGTRLAWSDRQFMLGWGMFDKMKPPRPLLVAIDYYFRKGPRSLNPR